MLAPLAVKVTLLPLQKAADAGETVTVGNAFIVAVAAVLVVETQPVLVFLAWA